MERLTLARGAFAVLTAGLLILGIHSAALRGWADASYTRARLELDTGKREPAAEALAAARVAIDEAIQFEPSNPHFVEYSARLHEREALALVPGDAETRRLLGRSLEEVRTAARMRPGSPYVWARIAALKMRVGELDAEFYGALERAGRLGPWEPQVQLAMAEIGLAAWRRLAQPAQSQVIGALERGLLRPEAGIRRIVAAPGFMPLVCATPQLPPRLASLCVKK